MQSEWVHSEEKKKACAGYENHVNGYNVYQDAQITPTNEDKSCLAHTSTHTFNQLRILYTAYMYTLNWTDRGRASVEVIIVIVIVIECWIPTTEQFHNGIVLIEIHLNGIGKYGYFFCRLKCVCAVRIFRAEMTNRKVGEIFDAVVVFHTIPFETHQNEKLFRFSPAWNTRA